MTSPSQKPRSGRGIKIALGLSLALNLLVAGVVAGGMLRARMQPDAAPRTMMAALWGALPDPLRDDLRGQFAPMRQGREGAREHRAAQAAALSQALRAEAFDPATLEALLGDPAGRELRAAQMRQALVAAISGLTPPERAALAARFEERLERRGWR